MSKADLERLEDVAWSAFSRDQDYRIGPVVRAILQAIRESEDWRIDTLEGAEIMARRKTAYLAACKTMICEGRAGEQGNCAYCADVSDNVIHAYIDALLDESE